MNLNIRKGVLNGKMSIKKQNINRIRELNLSGRVSLPNLR